MRAHALAYAQRRGLRILPLQPNGKLPLTEHGSKDASSDTDVIAAWWTRWPDANVGIATGDGLVVVDLDGSEGIAGWEALERMHGSAATLAAATGSGGQHRFYTSAARLPNSAGRLGRHIDTRGEGGYIVAPPSIHPNGTPYTWENRLEIAAAPDWLVTALRPPKRLAPPRLQPYQDVTAYGRGALDRMRSDMLAAPEGSRNETLNRLAWTAGRLCAGGQLARADCAQLIAAAESTGLMHREVEATFSSGFTAGLNDDPIAPREPPRQRVVTTRPPRLLPPRMDR